MKVKKRRLVFKEDQKDKTTKCNEGILTGAWIKKKKRDIIGISGGGINRNYTLDDIVPTEDPGCGNRSVVKVEAVLLENTLQHLEMKC